MRGIVSDRSALTVSQRPRTLTAINVSPPETRQSIRLTNSAASKASASGQGLSSARNDTVAAARINQALPVALP